jgi:peptidoglycan/xylan/chitin deacetylase (PgdA/CDA1 family)
MRVPILTYHAMTPYDHGALAEDLEVIRQCGFRVIRLQSAIDALLKEGPIPEGNCVAITFDDGPDFDWFDVVRPEAGLIRSFANILREAASPKRSPQRKGGSHASRPTATSFVIASPEARAILDRACIAGLDEWRDVWWAEAHRGGTLEIANHSWDHAHDKLPTVAQRDQVKGHFYGIDTYEDADAQIRRAEDYIEATLGMPSARLFAYPYGGFVEYLCCEYLPDFIAEHRQRAALTTHADFLTEGSDRWKVPRFVCGWHWKNPDELRNILESIRVKVKQRSRLMSLLSSATK